jgi:nitroreductase
VAATARIVPWMEHVDTARTRRMVRSFSGAPVEPSVLDSLLDLAARAPAAGNADGRAFVVLSGPDETKGFWDATTDPEWRETSRRWTGMKRAPVVVVVLVSPAGYMARYAEHDKASSGLGPDGGDAAWPVPYWFFDAGAAVMALLLGATDCGLGACFLGNFRGEERLLESLGVEPNWRYAGAVLIGEPGGSDPPSSSAKRGRTAFSEVVRRGSWGG